MRHLDDRRIVFFGGKGGVGKTTCASAFALAAGARGRRVLLVSTDPAHSTSDIFERTIGPDEVPLADGLWGLEVDAERESAAYVGRVKRDVEGMFGPHVIAQAYRQIDLAAASPGLAEVALLDRMISIVLDREARYDLIVFDTAPTGHTLHLLRMPDAMTSWIRALVKHRRAVIEIDQPSRERAGGSAEPDPILEALERRHERLVALHDRLTDRDRTAFVLVTIPERLPIEETARAASLLDAARIPIGGIVVNRVLPDGLGGEFYEARKAQELGYLAEISRRFDRRARTIVRQLPRDVYGLEALRAVAAQLE